MSKRRDSLKALLAGSGAILAGRIPDSWTRPVIASVMIPAHAQTTRSSCLGFYCSGDLRFLVTEPNNIEANLNGTCFFVGTYDANGFFNGNLDCDLIIRGTVNADCSHINGTVCNNVECSSIAGFFDATPCTVVPV